MLFRINEHSPQQRSPGGNFDETVHSKADERNAARYRARNNSNQTFKQIPSDRKVFEPSPVTRYCGAFQNRRFRHDVQYYDSRIEVLGPSMERPS